MKDIIALEGVQRQFTKRLPGMKACLTYHQRLTKLDLESLEFGLTWFLRDSCIRADLILRINLYSV